MFRSALLALLLVGSPVWSTLATAQSYETVTGTRTTEVAPANALDLNKATAFLEQYLEKNGVTVPTAKAPEATPQPQPAPSPQPAPTPQPPSSPPGTPIAGPMPLPPPGPGTFIVLPPTLEAYRVQLEKKRTLLEMSLDANRVSKSEYETELSEYRRNIVIYKKASTLVLSAGDRAGGRE